MSGGYDSRCKDLAEVFLEDSDATPAATEELAQCIQDAIENWLNEWATNQAEVLADRTYHEHDEP